MEKTITVSGIEYTIRSYPSNIIITTEGQDGLYRQIECSGDRPIRLSGETCTRSEDLAYTISKHNLKKLLNRTAYYN